MSLSSECAPVSVASKKMPTSAELIWLLAAVAKGDEAAFSQLYAQTAPRLYGVVLGVLPNGALADDVLQKTYVTIWTGAAQFDLVLSSPMTWMVAIARSLAIDVLRAGVFPAEPEPDGPSTAAPPDVPAHRDLTNELQRLLACMGRLDEGRRRLVLNAYFSGCTRFELAEQTGTPEATIRPRLRSALAAIAECLDR